MDRLVFELKVGGGASKIALIVRSIAQPEKVVLGRQDAARADMKRYMCVRECPLPTTDYVTIW